MVNELAQWHKSVFFSSTFVLSKFIQPHCKWSRIVRASRRKSLYTIIPSFTFLFYFGVNFDMIAQVLPRFFCCSCSYAAGVFVLAITPMLDASSMTVIMLCELISRNSARWWDCFEVYTWNSTYETFWELFFHFLYVAVYYGLSVSIYCHSSMFSVSV